jgi:hypothetical protein
MMMMISNIKRFELSASLGWVKLTRREDGEEILLYPEDALNLAARVAQNQEALADACQRLEAEEELARRSVGAPDLPTCKLLDSMRYFFDNYLTYITVCLRHLWKSLNRPAKVFP